MSTTVTKTSRHINRYDPSSPFSGAYTLGGSGGVTAHAALTQLDYASAGHTGFQAALTFGIANTNSVVINSADVADNDYAKFTATGLEGRSYSEVLSDIGAAPLASPTFTGTVTAPSLIVEDLTDGYIPYQKAADDKLSDSIIYYDGTNVGIGLSAPDTLLHLYSATDVHLRLAKSTTGRYDLCVGTLTANNDFWIEDIINSTAPFYINNSGNVGIGTITPQVRTDIKNVATAAIASLSASPNGTFNIGSYDTTGIMNFGQYGGSYGWIQVRNTAANGEAYPLVLNPLGGNVGIGFTTPLSALCINGGLHIGGESAAGDNNLLIDGTLGIGVTPNEIISVYKGSAANVLAQFINSNTGSGASDGFFIGIEADGTAILNQKESGTLGLATNGLLRAQFTSAGNFQHPSFVTGWETAGGTKWQIDIDGNAELENLIVRGSARFRELIIDQLAIIAGSQLLSVARGKILSVDTVNSKVTLDDPNDVGASAFAVDDFFWIKNIDIDHSIFSDCKGQITAITDLTLTLDFGVADASGAITDIMEGDIIVQRGHPTTASRQNLIYTTVSDTGAPFRRVMTGVDSLAAFVDLDNVVSQEGNLVTLDSHDIVPASPGYGYYSSNVYLSGMIVAESGSIANWTISASALSTGAFDTNGTMYLGTSGLSLSNTFKVTSAGALTATSGAIGGWDINANSLTSGSDYGLYNNGGAYLAQLGLFNQLIDDDYIMDDDVKGITQVKSVYTVSNAMGTDKTLYLPDYDVSGNTSYLLHVIHPVGSDLGSHKFHISGNSQVTIFYKGNIFDSIDLGEGCSVTLMWDSRTNIWQEVARTGLNIQEVVDTYSITDFEDVIICNKGTAFTVTLPVADAGKTFIIKNIGAGTVTLDAESGDTIDGSATQSIVQWDSLTVLCYESNKWVLL